MEGLRGALITRTEAKRHEILAAAAGYVLQFHIEKSTRPSYLLTMARYCAVLVVFLGNVGNYGNGTGSLPGSG
jgi:hypothetical protein